MTYDYIFYINILQLLNITKFIKITKIKETSICGNGRMMVGDTFLGRNLSIIAQDVQAINVAIPVSGIKYGAESFHTAATAPGCPSLNISMKASPTCSGVINPPTFCFISAISSVEKLLRIGVVAIDGQIHIIRMDFSDMAAAMHLVAATTALFDEL